MSEEKSFKYVELFAGILGFGTAIDRIGGENVFVSEIEEEARRVIKALKPNCNLHGDITKVESNEIPQHDLLVAGFPCQPFTQSGKRLGYKDARGTLFFDIIRIMKDRKPKVALLENVKGLASHDEGNTLRIMLQLLNDIGYNVDFEILDSKYFDVPQQRERIYIVAVRNDIVEYERWKGLKGNYTMIPTTKRRLQKIGVQSFNFEFPKQEYISKKLTDILEDNVDKKYYLSDSKLEKLLHSNMPTSSISDGYWIREATVKGYSIANVGDSVNILYPSSTTRRGRVGKQIASTAVASDCSQAVVEFDEVEGRLKLRKLTPKEYWRLQSFSDEAFLKAMRLGIKDRSLYRLAGNAVTVNAIESIGKNLLKYIHKEID